MALPTQSGSTTPGSVALAIPSNLPINTPPPPGPTPGVGSVPIPTSSLSPFLGGGSSQPPTVTSLPATPVTSPAESQPQNQNIAQPAPAGYQYGPNGQLQPINAASNPDVASQTSTSQNASSLSAPNSYNDVMSAIQNNIEQYQNNAAGSQQEQQDELAYKNTLSAYQNFQTNLQAGELNQYGGGGMIGAAGQRASTIGLQNQVEGQTLENAVNVSQAALQNAITEQGIGVTQGQNALQDLLSLGSQGLTQQQVNLSALAYTKMTADQQAQYDVSYFQTFGTMPPSSITGEDSGGSPTGSGSGAGSSNGTMATPSAFANDGSTPSMTGTDFGGYDISSYASIGGDAYAQRLTPLYQAAQQGIQSISPSGIQSYINQIAPGSPITGQMIYNAAINGGGTGAPVDPYMLVAQEQLESKLGTDGTATSTMNPANVGNTGTSTKTMASWQDGVNAQAAWLANHPAQSSQSNSSTGSDAFSSAMLQQAQSYFPPTVQQAVQVMPNGIPYVNMGLIPSNLQTMASNIAQENGIKTFSSDDVSGLEALGNISDALNKMVTLSTQDLQPANGGLGTAENMIGNWWGSVTGTNPSLADFGIFKDSAIKSVTALAGGLGSGLRLNTGTIEAAVNNLPTQNDSQEVAIEKIDETRDLLNIQLSQIFGNPSLSQGALTMNGHTYMPGDVVSNGQGGLGTVNADGSVTPIQ